MIFWHSALERHHHYPIPQVRAGALVILVFPPLKVQDSLEFNDAELRKNIKLGRREPWF
jgi:hypothetical protein